MIDRRVRFGYRHVFRRHPKRQTAALLRQRTRTRLVQRSAVGRSERNIFAFRRVVLAVVFDTRRSAEAQGPAGKRYGVSELAEIFPDAPSCVVFVRVRVIAVGNSDVCREAASDRMTGGADVKAVFEHGS